MSVVVPVLQIRSLRLSEVQSVCSHMVNKSEAEYLLLGGRASALTNPYVTSQTVPVLVNVP